MLPNTEQLILLFIGYGLVGCLMTLAFLSQLL
jgi:hypothetical protein